MKRISIWIMKINLQSAIKKQQKEENEIVKSAYSNCIRTYGDAIMFLEAELESERKHLL